MTRAQIGGHLVGGVFAPGKLSPNQKDRYQNTTGCGPFGQINHIQKQEKMFVFLDFNKQEKYLYLITNNSSGLASQKMKATRL